MPSGIANNVPVPDSSDAQVVLSGLEKSIIGSQNQESIQRPIVTTILPAQESITERGIYAVGLDLDRQLAELKNHNDSFVAHCQHLDAGINVMQESIRLLESFKDHYTSISGHSHLSTTTPPLSPQRSFQVERSLSNTNMGVQPNSPPTIDREADDFLKSLQKLQQAMNIRAAWLADEISAYDALIHKQEMLAQVLCNICLERHPDDDIFRMDHCEHAFCLECIQTHIISRVQEQRHPIFCPTCVAGDAGGGEPQSTDKISTTARILRLICGYVLGITVEIAKRAGLPGYHVISFRQLVLRASRELVECRRSKSPIFYSSSLCILKLERRCWRTNYVDKETYARNVHVSCPARGCGYAWCKRCDQEIQSGKRHSCDGSYELDDLITANQWRRCPGEHEILVRPCYTLTTPWRPVQPVGLRSRWSWVVIMSLWVHICTTAPDIDLNERLLISVWWLDAIRALTAASFWCSFPLRLSDVDICARHFCYACGVKIGRSTRPNKIKSLVEAHYRKCTLFDVPPDLD